MHPDLQPMIQIRANSVIVYNKWLGSRKKFDLQRFKNQQKIEVQNFENNKAYSGELTTGAIKRMSRALNLFIESAENKVIWSPVLKKKVRHKLSFITLTIPTNEKIELKTASKLLLEPLLKHLRQVHNMRSYIWKVELQERGQLHYHLVSDVYIHYQELRNKWNRLLSKNNFNVEYVTEKGHNNANSTDIHSVKKVKDLSSYLLKYFTKKSQNPKGLSGKIWDCSKNLKAARYFETELTEDFEYDIFNLEVQNKVVLKRSDSFTFIKFKGLSAVSCFPKETKEAYYLHLFHIREATPELFESSKNRTVKVDTCIENRSLPQIVPKNLQLKLYLN